ncbi:MAG: phosphate signaling complex protein PhoU [Chromatiales bacterium]|nr:phosphate signaling complex protein PhoU [Chromatiales bacterium]
MTNPIFLLTPLLLLLYWHILERIYGTTENISSMNDNLPQHSVAQFEREIKELKGLVLRMAGAVEQRVATVVEAIAEGNADRTQWVIESDSEINNLERQVDEMCVGIMARRQPVAIDLRLLTTALKISTDLERIGDETQRIAQVIKKLNFSTAPEEMRQTFRELGAQVISMLHDAIDSYARNDVELSTHTCKQDRYADQSYRTLLEEQLPEFTRNNIYHIPYILDLVWCARSLERIGDHTKNVAEQVIYMVEATDVRHRKVKSLSSH